MNRRRFLAGAGAALGGALAGCTAAADEETVTNDLVLVNRMSKETVFEVQASGPTERKLTYDVEPGRVVSLTDYVSEGAYDVTVVNEIEVETNDGGTKQIRREATTGWNPEDCHDLKIQVFQARGIQFEKDECDVEPSA
jgi:hypothetical protein